MTATVFCVTLEPYDRDNASGISNINAQQYICKKIISPKFGETFEITNVQGRTEVVIHPGNFDDNTEACVLLAQHFGKLGYRRAILNSGATFRKFMELMKYEDEFMLTIIECY